MRIRLPDDEQRQLKALTDAARQRTGRALSASGWLRGAVRLAADDHTVADRIVDAAPDTGHGGERPGAGRPTGRSETREEPDDGAKGHDQEDS